MAALGISEFMFGYAFLHEQTQKNWSTLKAAPVLPSLHEEKSKGWDAHLPLIGTDFYYQFKLSDKLSGGNAKYIRSGLYKTPYYRLALYRKDKNRQHRRLKAHSASNPRTYYVAPEFDTLSDFNDAFIARRIADGSRLIPVAKCKNVSDNEQHFITFLPAKPSWKFHSEPTHHNDSFRGDELEELYRGTKPYWKPIDKTYSEELYGRTVSVLKRSLEDEDKQFAFQQPKLFDFDPRRAERNEILSRVADILSVSLGVTLVIVGMPSESAPQHG